jgi:hypothetical protein
MTNLMSSTDKAQASGCLFLMPKPIHDTYRRLSDESVSTLQELLTKQNINTQTVESLKINLISLQETMQEALGLSKLNKFNP